MMISIDNNNLNSCDHHDFGADNSAVLFKQSRVKFQEEYKGKFSKIHFSLLGFGQPGWPCMKGVNLKRSVHLD